MTRALIVVITAMTTLVAIAHAGVVRAEIVQAGFVEEGRSTIERMNALLQKTLDDIALQVRADSLSIRVAVHPDAEFIRALAINAIGARNVVAEMNPRADLFITPVDVSTRYEETSAADSVDRVISMTLKAVLTENGNAKVLRTEDIVERERLHRKDAIRLQSEQRASTHGPIPPMTTTIWDDILQPAIFVVAAVTTVVLLFTVRSQ